MSTKNSCGKILEDQAIEETINKQSKIPGGIVGKSRFKDAVNQWVETTADRAQITENIRYIAGTKADDDIFKHSEAMPARMRRDESDIQKVVNAVSSMIDPFEYSEDLMSISNGVTASPSSVDDLFGANSYCEREMSNFIRQRIVGQQVDFFKPITKSKLKTFSSDVKQKTVKVGDKELQVKADRNFFRKLVVIAKMPDLDLSEVYSHELGPVPWSIATAHGTLYKATKALLLEDLENDIPPTRSAPPQAVWIMDGFSNIQVLKEPKPLDHEGMFVSQKGWKPTTFRDVAESILSHIYLVTKPLPLRIDFVIDTYPDVSIKESEHQRRAGSSGRRVKITSAAQRAPTSWDDYLKCKENKRDLPGFLVKEWSSVSDKQYVKRMGNVPLFACHGAECTRLKVVEGGNGIQSTHVPALSNKADEADARLIFHAKQADDSGARTVVIRSSDTDVMVLAIHFQNEIAASILIQRQSGRKKWKLVNVRSIQQNLGPDICEALPGFHSFSGCDTTSGFYGKTKHLFFKMLKDDQSFCNAMKKIGVEVTVTDDVIKACEKSICKIYKHDYNDINQVRYEMLTSGAESHEIPPSKDALVLHIKRANYQALVWRKALDPAFVPPSPVENGWKMNNGCLDIEWITKEPAPRAVLELISCKNCKKCSRRCPCKAKGFKCTDACKCDGNVCANSEDSGRHVPVPDFDDEDEDVQI